MSILLDEGEINNEIDNALLGVMSGDVDLGRVIAQAQLRKVVEWLEDRRYWGETMVSYIIGYEEYDALRREAGLEG